MITEIYIKNANSRDTYFSVHNILKAHNYSTGKGIKVGIIDWLFGLNANKELYTGCTDISGNHDSVLSSGVKREDAKRK
jgi:hypothetical protein